MARDSYGKTSTRESPGNFAATFEEGMSSTKLAPPSSKPAVILVADDEVMIRNLMRLALEADGHFVLQACDGEEALRLSREYSGHIDMLVSDVKMPKLDGVALRDRIATERPGIRILLVSGFTDTPILVTPFLAKPFEVEELRARVRQLLGFA
jgi:DNA-binding response OmpR family regulator